MQEDDLSPIEQAIRDRHAREKEESDRQKLLSGMDRGFRDASDHSSDSIRSELRKGVRVNNFEDMPHPDNQVHTHTHIHGIEKLDVDSVTVNGLEELVSLFLRGMDQVIDKLEKLEIRVPDIKVPQAHVTFDIPEIKVPEPKVTVNVPEPKVIVQEKREVSIPSFRKEKEEPVARIVEEKPIYAKDGTLDGYEEIYSDRSTIRKTGIATGKVKYDYGKL